MKNLEYIDSYFQGLLLPEEKNRFEKKLTEDPEFAEDVAFYLSVEKIATEQLQEDKKTRFRELYRQNSPRTAVIRPMKRTWAYAAAAVVLFLIVGVYLY